MTSDTDSQTDSVLEVFAYGAWNGGIPVDNSHYEKLGMQFKGGKPVTNDTIEARIGVRTRMAAPDDERIGATAMGDLLATSDIAPSKIKLLVGATNVGDDKYDRAPQVRYAYELIRDRCPQALVIDLYAGCPGYNVAVELAFMLSLGGILKKDDLSVIVGAENIHRARAFKPLDTANIIFGDDALATALRTTSSRVPAGLYTAGEHVTCRLGDDIADSVAERLAPLVGTTPIDGIIVDNQMGDLTCRVPASAARVQHALALKQHPDAAARVAFSRFADAMRFYDAHVNSFAFDIKSTSNDPRIVETIARAYVESGKYGAVVSVHISVDLEATLVLHSGRDFQFRRPLRGIVDTRSRTHGCFGDYIMGFHSDGDVFGKMDGKGVFLYATRGAPAHLTGLLVDNALTIGEVDLLIEHQANFALIPMTMERVLDQGQADLKNDVADFVANRMITNIHERGNCSVVCMQRLPYDLERDRLAPDSIQGFAINQNLEGLKQAKVILNDSVGSGMTRSSFLQRL